MIPSKVVLNLKLPNDDETHQLLKMLTPFEVAFCHSANELPNEYYELSEKLPPGSILKVTLEVIDGGSTTEMS